MSGDDDPDEHAIGYQVLPRGTPVLAADDVEVGTFHKALHHGREHLFDGMVIRTGEGRLFVDAPEVARTAERAVTLEITAAEADELSPPETDRRGLRGGAGRLSRLFRGASKRR